MHVALFRGGGSSFPAKLDNLTGIHGDVLRVADHQACRILHNILRILRQFCILSSQLHYLGKSFRSSPEMKPGQGSWPWNSVGNHTTGWPPHLVVLSNASLELFAIEYLTSPLLIINAI